MVMRSKFLKYICIVLLICMLLPTALVACKFGGDTETESQTEVESESESATETQSATESTPPAVTEPDSATETESPTATETEPPVVTETQPPKVTETEPPKVTETEPPVVTETQPPKVTETEPPKVTETEPPKVTETEPPKVTETEPPKVTETEPPKVTETEPPKVTETEPPAETEPPVEPEIPGQGQNNVIITKVFGTGGKTDAAMGASFVELYNTADTQAVLTGTALYYGEGSSFVMLDLKNVTIEPKSYYLIKCASVNGYDTSFEVLRIDQFDLEWGVTIDNKEFELALAYKNSGITPGSDFDANSKIISYVKSSETENVNIYHVSNLSKNRMIVRSELVADIGYHRINLSKAGTAELEKITPQTSKGNVNTYISSNFNEVTFSKEGGVYKAAVRLQLEGPDGWTIYYTTDGTDPRLNGTKYPGMIRINSTNSQGWGPTINLAISRDPNARPAESEFFGGCVVKAYATNGTDSTAVYTQSYFVSNDLRALDTKVISMSVDPQLLLGAGGAYYDFPLFETRPRTRVFIEVFDEEGGRRGGSYAEVAVSGNGSSGLPMKSLRVYYKDPIDINDPALDSLEYDLFDGNTTNTLGQTITSFDRILLRNGGNDFGITMLRDAFSQKMASDLNVDSMAYEPVLVFINGEFWGMYNLRERYSPEYFNRKYGVLEDNVVILENVSPLANNSWDSDYVASTGNELIPHDAYAKEFNDLVVYIKSHDLSQAEHYDYVAERLDIESFIDYWIVNTYFCNPDWPGNNIKVWKNISPDDPSGTDTKWKFLTLDLDMGLAYPANSAITLVDWNKFSDIAENTRCGAIMYNLCKNSDFCTQFARRAYEVVTEKFTYAQTSAVWNSLADDIRDLMAYQYKRFPSHGNIVAWEAALDTVEDFLSRRSSYYLNYLYAQFNTSEEEILNNTSYVNLTVNLNMSGSTVKVDNSAVKYSAQRFKYSDSAVSVKVSVTAKAGYAIDSITFVGKSGKTQTFAEGSFTLDLTESGTLTVVTRLEAPVVITDVVTGMHHTFAIDDNGRLFAWGNHTGISGGEIITTPQLVMEDVAKVATTRGFDTVANSTNNFTVAVITKDGKLYTMGDNTYGQLGRSGDTSSFGLVSFSGIVVDVAIGSDHMLVLDSNGGLWGIGNNTYGQLGAAGFGGAVTSFQKIADGVKKISAGRSTTYYIDNSNNLWGVGDNRWYKINAADPSTKITTPYKMLSAVKDVQGSMHQTLILTNDGKLYYIGQRDLTQGFIAVSEYRDAVELIANDVKYAEMYSDHIIILKNNGDVYGFGFNTNGQIGQGVSSPALEAVKITSGAVDVAAGAGFSVIVMQDGSVIFMGSNTHGNAANGTSAGNVNMHTVEFPYIP